MIDIDKYEGHTPAPWNLTPEGHIVADDMTVVCNKHTKRIVETNHKDTQLIADAPILLQEVKRLHKILHIAENNIPRRIHWDCYIDALREAGLEEGEDTDKYEECKECGFPIDPDNEVYPTGSECICDLKEEQE